MGKRRCRECGEVYEDSFQNCPACGTARGRKIARCKECGSRLAGAKGGRCPVCGARQTDWSWVKPALRLVAVLVVLMFLGATYVYSYVPQLGMPAPSWPTPTTTITVTPSLTVTPVAPTRTRTPTLTRVPPTATKVPPVTYVVKFGDTLGVIAERFGISLEALMIANNLTDSSFIKEEQVLIIPSGTPTPLIQATPTVAPPAPVTRLPIATSTPKP
jgi:LysM repeat protein/RNA polymerase subunit RPABC4/transcription elongation factor Spt4